MKKIISMILCLVLVFSMSACGSSNGNGDKTDVSAGTVEEAPNPDTEGAKLYAEFNKALEEGKSMQEIAEYLAQGDVSGFECGTMECEEGYLNGFSEEIKGFSSCYVIQPWIGSIPFVCYIFESDNVGALKEAVLKAADPRWNICTEAEETIALINGNHLFFAMLPGAEG